MSELRFDVLTDGWSVVAPERAARPRVVGDSRALCPFCPEHEHMTPAETMRAPRDGPGWQLRVVANKFAVFDGPQPAARHENGAGFLAMETAGAHEVVIESPDHGWDMSYADHEEVRIVIDAYRTRFRALRKTKPATIVVFRNHGEGAGTSIVHPHSQIVASPVVPLQMRQHMRVAARYFDVYGQCLYAELRDREVAAGARIVLENGHFVVLQPYAPQEAFETWIMPKRHRASFGDVDNDEIASLADVLPRTLRALDYVVGNPDYNMLIQSAPLEDEHLSYFLWHLRIIPRLGTVAGFELATGIPITPALPEHTAAQLREAIEQDRDS